MPSLEFHDLSFSEKRVHEFFVFLFRQFHFHFCKMQSLVPQFGQSTRLIVFTPPFLKIIPNGLHSLLPHQVGKFNTKFPTFQKPISFQKNNLKPTIASKPLFTKKTGIIASRGFATNNSGKDHFQIHCDYLRKRRC